MTNYIAGQNALHAIYGSQPILVLAGTEGSGVTWGFRENAGNLEFGTVTLSGTAPTLTATWGTTYYTLGNGVLNLNGATGINAVNDIKISKATPAVELIGSEGSAINVLIRENGGKVEIYTGSSVVATLYPLTYIATARHVAVKPATGAAEVAADVWKESIFEAPSGGCVVTDVGVIPDYGSTMGQATNYYTLTCRNKGHTDGTGTTSLCAKTFNSAATVCLKASFGAVSNATLAAEDVLTIEKTITSSGMIVQACAYYIEYTRTS